MKGSDNTTGNSGRDSFYSRWSSRKQSARDGAELDEEITQPVVEEKLQQTDADMPPVESLEESSDFTGFMSPKVSDQLRRVALRKLFHSATFNTCDGLDDYAEDFTTFAKLGDLITSDMRFQIEQEALKKDQEQLPNDVTPEQVASDEELAEAEELTEDEYDMDEINDTEEFIESENEA